jgi:hypothetical protein
MKVEGVGVKNLDSGAPPVIEFRRAYPFKRSLQIGRGYAEAEGLATRPRTEDSPLEGRPARPADPTLPRGNAAVAGDFRMLEHFPGFKQLSQGETV